MSTFFYTSSREKSKSSQKNILNQIRSLNQLRFIMLTRSQDCVSHHGLVLHETPTSESTKSTRSCFGADIKVAGVGSFLDSCLPVGIAGKSMHNNWQHVWQAESEHIHCDECYMISPMGEPFWRNCQVPGIVKNPVHLALVYVVLLKPQLYLTDCLTLE